MFWILFFERILRSQWHRVSLGFFRRLLQTTDSPECSIKHIAHLGLLFLFSSLFYRCFFSRHGGLPIRATRRVLNSRSVPEGLHKPAWCRGYHAGLSFLRPGFNSRSGRLLLTMMGCYCATNAAPDLDSVFTRSDSSDVNTCTTLALDDVAHNHPNHCLFINSTIGYAG